MAATLMGLNYTCEAGHQLSIIFTDKNPLPKLCPTCQAKWNKLEVWFEK
jgi:hypothetical protein